MALAEQLHHSAQKVVEQKTASAREGKEFKKNALYEAPRKQKTPLSGVRTVSTAPVPQVVLPDLGGEVVHDDALAAFLVRQTLFGREEKKRKEKEEEKRMKFASKTSLRLSMHGQVPHVVSAQRTDDLLKVCFTSCSRTDLNVQPYQVRFLFNGVRCSTNDTLDKLGLEIDNILEVVLSKNLG